MCRVHEYGVSGVADLSRVEEDASATLSDDNEVFWKDGDAVGSVTGSPANGFPCTNNASLDELCVGDPHATRRNVSLYIKSQLGRTYWGFSVCMTATDT